MKKSSADNRTVASAGLALVFLLGLFSTPIADTDFWWHLKTGEFIFTHRALPFPDPFAYTTGTGGRFNLTHEWLAQVVFYLIYPAIVLFRAATLTAVCALSGRVWTALATASVAVAFTADRPALLSFLFVAVFVWMLERGRWLWWLPLLSCIWANCHGGFFLGWIVLLAYCVESWRSRRLWLIAASSIIASGINPNGFGVVSTLVGYSQSSMTANLVEWGRPSWWGDPYGFDILLYASAAVLIVSWRRVRVAHWILYAAFAAASLLAFRNILLIGFLAPILIAEYFPYRLRVPWWAPALVAVGGLAVGIAQGRLFRFGVAEWTVPSAAADYLLANNITGAMFNTYEQGGYLIWRLWPHERVFIDGRALSESVYKDYRQILFNEGAASDQIAGPRAELLQRYGIRVVMMNTIDSVSGALYPVALALANSADWRLVYDDAQDVIFVRDSAAPNQLGRILKHLDAECLAYVENGDANCARTLADFWTRNGVMDRARRMQQLRR